MKIAAAGLIGMFALAGFCQERIVFTSDRSGSYDLWMMDEQRAGLSRLTFDPGDERVPEFSPDGRRIMFIKDSTSLFIMNDDGTEQQLVRDFGVPFYLFEWSDSDWIYVAVNDPGCFPDDFRRLRPDGSEETILLDGVPVHGATEGSFGEVMYVQAVYCWTPASRISIMDAFSNPISVVRPNDGKAEFWVSKANTSDFVTFHQSDSPQGHSRFVNIYVMSWDGTWSMPITNAASNEKHFFPVFSPEDRSIACQYSNGGDWNIAILDSDGSNFRLLTDHPGFDGEPDWGPPSCSFGPEDQPVIFERGRGKPIVESLIWSSCGGEGTLVLACDSVSAAVVVLEGEVLLGPDDFAPKIDAIEVPVTLLEGENQLEIELRGKPGSTIAVNFLAPE